MILVSEVVFLMFCAEAGKSNRLWMKYFLASWPMKQSRQPQSPDVESSWFWADTGIYSGALGRAMQPLLFSNAFDFIWIFCPFERLDKTFLSLFIWEDLNYCKLICFVSVNVNIQDTFYLPRQWAELIGKGRSTTMQWADSPFDK